MRAILAALALLAAVAILPPPAAALSNCGGTWAGSASCSFSCDDVNLYVRGTATDFAGLPASVTVTAECGVVQSDGTFLPLYSVSCSAVGPVSVACVNTGPNIAFPMTLVGVCTVVGNTIGMYDCLSAP